MRGNLLSFPVKSSVYFYSDRKPRAWKNLGNGPGVGKCPVPGQHKICNCPTPGTDKAGKCPAVAAGGGGGRAGRSWNWLMHYKASEATSWATCYLLYFNGFRGWLVWSSLQIFCLNNEIHFFLASVNSNSASFKMGWKWRFLLIHKQQTNLRKII